MLVLSCLVETGEKKKELTFNLYVEAIFHFYWLQIFALLLFLTQLFQACFPLNHEASVVTLPPPKQGSEGALLRCEFSSSCGTYRQVKNSVEFYVWKHTLSISYEFHLISPLPSLSAPVLCLQMAHINKADSHTSVSNLFISPSDSTETHEESPWLLTLPSWSAGWTIVYKRRGGRVRV